MNKMLPWLLLVSAALGTCAEDHSLTSIKPVRWLLGEAEQNPTLEDISPDQVIVMGNGAAESAVQAEAARGCVTYHRTPVLKSQTCIDNLCQRKRYVFACRAV
jgi:hypothetical protein